MFLQEFCLSEMMPLCTLFKEVKMQTEVDSVMQERKLSFQSSFLVFKLLCLVKDDTF